MVKSERVTFRLTPSEREHLEGVRQRFSLPSLSAAARHSIHVEAAAMRAPVQGTPPAAESEDRDGH